MEDSHLERKEARAFAQLVNRRRATPHFRPDPVPDDVWDEAARHYDEQALAALVLQIANINLWNRLNIATRQVAGAYEW